MKRYSLLISGILLGMQTLYAQDLKLNEQNIDAIVAAMTLEEKVSLIVGAHDSDNQPAGETMIGYQEKIVPGAAGTTIGIPRLGIPATVFTDGPAGVRISEQRKGTSRTYYATGFPIATALASTWDVDLVYQTTKAMGNETLEYGCDVLLAPGTNIHRHPLCGRNFEYFSEDPVLSGKMSAAYINGVQSEGVGTSIKHFVANNQETLRMYNDSRVGERVLREIYLRPFEIALQESNPWTVMSSYNKLNGTFTQENHWLLTELLRDEWGYDGVVVTDWTGTRNTVAQVAAGNDHLQPGTDQQVQDLVAAAKRGDISMDDINRAVRRMLQFIVKTPRFKGYKYSDAPDLAAHAALVRQCGSECMVLLKNQHSSLPMKSGCKVSLFGITSYDMIAGGTGSGDVHKAYISQLSDALEAQGFMLDEELKNLYTNYKSYAVSKRLATYGNGGEWQQPLLGEALVDREVIDRQAMANDIAVITLGRTAGEAADRKITDDFNITEVERLLLSDVCDAFHLQGKAVVVILNTSGAMETASWKHSADAILMTWQPGQEVGNSIADVLSGRVNPSGRLPMTLPNNATDHLSSRNFPLFGGNERMAIQSWNPRPTLEYTDYEEGLLVGYRYFTTAGMDVSYPFGFGLSYTTFEMGNEKVKAGKNDIEVKVTVRNTGTTAGREVVQIYVALPRSGQPGEPIAELKAFAKTRLLAPAESQELTLTIPRHYLRRYDESLHQWVFDKGAYEIRICSDANTVRLRKSVSL